MSRPMNGCRYLCSELVSVLYEDHAGHTHQAVANLEEISSTEAILLTEEQPPSGLPISFCAKQHDLYGVVESSELHPELGWFVKVKLAGSSRWHGRMFVPEHFIALCQSTFSDVTEDVTSRVR